jgi:chemotaxis family two-component system sensor kinase Cph1
MKGGSITMVLQGSESPEKAALDDLYERNAFEKLLAAEAARMHRYGGTFSLLLVELDQPRPGLDAATREELIASAAELLRRHVRRSDYAAHWGAERFAILAPATDLTEAAGFAVKIRRLIAEHASGQRISASIGVAEADEGEPPGELFERCEKAMLSAVGRGGNRIAVDKTN